MGKYAEAIAEIDEQIAKLQLQIKELEQGRRTFILLEEIAKANEMIPTSHEYRGLGWTGAAKKLLTEVKHRMTTRDILVELMRRGVTTSAANKTGTLNSALKQRPDFFDYDRATGTWGLKEAK